MAPQMEPQHDFKHPSSGIAPESLPESTSEFLRRIQIVSSPKDAELVARVLTPDAQRFLVGLHDLFQPTRKALLARRQEVQAEIDSGRFPDFLKETAEVRRSDWKVAPIPADLQNRKVEITGPVERKMVIHALNSGAQVFMADFEDSHSPKWSGTLQGQVNLSDAVRRQIVFHTEDGRTLRLNEKTAVLFVRPRGWHLEEKHFLVDGQPISGALFDFGLYFFHNAQALIERGTGPYFYLPKMESHLEARLWNSVFVWAQKRLGIPNGTIRATVLIETILASFEMDEILFELRDHSAGLNCGRWDYIFSFIKKFNKHASFVMPDRASVTMNVHFLESYCQLLVQTCHRRGIHAMGGMAAQIPIKNDAEANAVAFERVRADKRREVGLGHDGTWVAHPGLVPVAAEIFNGPEFNGGVKAPNQIESVRKHVEISASDLLKVPEGPVTEVGVRSNILIALLYLESWIRGVGCLPIFNLMEDAATAEISRSQIWQWIRYGELTRADFLRILDEELGKVRTQLGPTQFASGEYVRASEILTEVSTGESFTEFLTVAAQHCLN